MSAPPIVESGMTFGPYEEGSCFHIEQSSTYRKIEDGVKMAEFLLLRSGHGQSPSVWIVEAKSSSPRPETQPNFDGFIDEIRDKLTNALTLGVAACLKRHPEAAGDLPTRILSLNLATTDFRLVLVLNGHKEEWLPPLQDSLAKALRPVVKTWALSATAVAVINDGIARGKGLIA